MPGERRVSFASADGLLLEGALHIAATDASCSRAAVILHPAPGAMGGDMDSYAVLALADAMALLGFSTLRFNFRGTGSSEGTSSVDGPRSAWGDSEAADVAGALSFLKAEARAQAVTICAYSFGAIAGIKFATANPGAVASVVAVGAPMMPEIAALSEPILLVSGEADITVGSAQLKGVALKHGASASAFVAGADHFSIPPPEIVRLVTGWSVLGGTGGGAGRPRL
jgi:alpha/beta superfamily hydrolase